VAALATDESGMSSSQRAGARAYASSRSVLITFTHCPCAFISNGKTGGLVALHRRGTDSIETLFSYLLFHIGPIFLQIVLVSPCSGTISASRCRGDVSVVIFYALYTAGATQWRMKFRREMNTQDREANARAVDSLLTTRR